MHETVVNGGTLDGVQHEAALKEVLQLCHLACVVLRQIPITQHFVLQVARWVDGSHDHNLFLEGEQGVKAMNNNKKILSVVFSGDTSMATKRVVCKDCNLTHEHQIFNG